MGLFGFLGEAIKPVANLVDNLHTSEEEKLRAKAMFDSMTNSILAQFIDYESQLNEAKARVVTAEALGHSWLQRNWRPITMLTFLVLVVCDSFGWLASPLAPEAWVLLQIGLGGYVVGRSVEKIIPKLSKTLKDK